MKESHKAHKNILTRDLHLTFIMVVAVLIRLVGLDIRPPHFDEGIVGWWVDQIIATGYYPYDPLNYHGPLPYYLVFFFKFFFGRDIWGLRLPTVILGSGAVFILAQFKEFLGRTTAYGAALLLAISPAAVYYSRYTPHEVGLLFFSILTCYGFVRYVEIRDAKSLLCLGLGFAGMATTKETFVIQVSCFIIAIYSLHFFEKIFVFKQATAEPSGSFTRKELLDVTLISVLLFVLMYSGFFLHFAGIIDFFKSFLAWFATGTKGNGHDKPFIYWTKLFWGYEWGALCGLVLTFVWAPVIAFNKDPHSRRAHWIRLFAVYGFGGWLGYSIIPYKTPWCVVQLVWPFFFVLSGFVEDCAKKKKWRSGILFLFFGLVVANAGQAIRISYFHTSDHLEPYVYVQSYPEIVELDKKMHALVQEDVNNFHMPIKVFMDDTWPLAWMWGDFTRVAWLGSQQLEKPDADVILADLPKRGVIEAHMTGSYYFQVFRLRDAQGESIMYMDTKKFAKFFGPSTPVYQGTYR